MQIGAKGKQGVIVNEYGYGEHLDKTRDHIKKGAAVFLNSGGPELTVIDVRDNNVRVKWFDDNGKEQRGDLPRVCLKDSNPVIGYIEPACDEPQWILWFMENGDAILHQKRDYANGSTGAVLDKPLRIKARRRFRVLNKAIALGVDARDCER